MSWHAEPAVLQHYAEGSLDDVRALPVEAHLLACEPCRLQLADLADRGRLDAVWERVVDAVEEPQRSGAERVLRRVGVPEHLARLVAAPPSLSGAWVVAGALCLVFAGVAAHVGPPGPVRFLGPGPLAAVGGRGRRVRAVARPRVRGLRRRADVELHAAAAAGERDPRVDAGARRRCRDGPPRPRLARGRLALALVRADPRDAGARQLRP